MANFTTRNRILKDSTLNPADFTAPRQAEVQNAVTLRGRIRSAIVDVANDSIPLNTLLTDLTSEQRDAALWAERIIEQADKAAGTILELLLASFDAATEAQIFAGNSNDADANAGDAALKAAILARRGALQYRASRPRL